MNKVSIMNIGTVGLIVVAGLSLAACHGSTYKCHGTGSSSCHPAPVAEPTPPPEPEPTPPAPVCKAEPFQVFFDTDLYEVTDEYAPAVKKLAACLAENPNQKVRLEGHADYRGTVAHNLVLSHNRAASVKEMLIANQAPESTITEVIGVGENPPLVEGRDAETLAKNRTTLVQIAE